MRKIRFKPLAVLAAVLVPLMAAGVITHTATYNYSNLTLGTDTLGGVTYTTVSYDGLYNGGDPGMPSLPIDYLRFSVPYNATNFTVTASTIGNNVITGIGHLLYPCQAPHMMNDTTPTITLPDSAAYYSNTEYPSQRAWVVEEGFLAGENHIVTVAVMPIAYKHSSSGLLRNTIRKASNISVTINYELSDNTPMRPIVREDSVLRQEGYQLTQSIVINPTQVTANAPTVDIPLDTLVILGRDDSESNNRSGFDPIFPPIDSLVVDTTGIHIGSPDWDSSTSYLIITTSEFKHAMRRLAALKSQKGFYVKIMTLDDVISDPHALPGDIIRKEDGTVYVPYTDDAGKIRQFLKFAHRHRGTKFVLLAGTDIPYRVHDHVTGATDMYYCELNSDWKGVFDRQPDIFVGRLLGKVSSQFENYTDKLFRYELNPGHGDFSYLKRALFTEGKDFMSFLDEARDNMDSICPNQTFIQENGHYPKGSDIVNVINNNQFGFICTFNHGDAPSITTSNPNGRLYRLWALDTVKQYSGSIPDYELNNGLNCIQNKLYPMIYFSPSCSTMPYDNPTEYYIKVNYGESFTTGKDYGGPAYMGNTRFINPEPSKQLTSIFTKNLNNFYYSLGEIDAYSKAEYSNRYIYDVSISHNFLGDPSLFMWTDTPQEYSGISVLRTDNRITVSGINTQFTTVAYADNSGLSYKKQASSSVTFNDVSPNGTIMVYKHNYIPYIAPLLLQNYNINNSQYVIASDVTAGRSIDSNRTSGDVVVKSDVEYEIEASGTVTLDRGFKVEKGAFFAVYPSTF
ncbi:MAG: hypothetical protein IJK93_00505 [Muribaculaceae bacterium]|nr:hypothetical protein [Muribaculaceae bacterium]